MRYMALIVLVALAGLCGCAVQQDVAAMVSTANAAAVDVIAIYNVAPSTPGIAQAAIDANANLTAALKVQQDFSGWPTSAALQADAQIAEEIVAWFLQNWQAITGLFGEKATALRPTVPLPSSAATAAQIEIWRNQIVVARRPLAP